MKHDEPVRGIRRPSGFPDGEGRAQLRELVRYATLAPSSHNTQCWRFHLEEHTISIRPDFSRRCPVVDPDDHHLYVSLGCALENLLQAARAHGLAAHVVVGGPTSGATRVEFGPGRPEPTPLFAAIPHRQCTRSIYDGRPLATAELRQLEEAGTGSGVRVVLLTDRPQMESVLEYVIEGNTAQMRNPAFVRELKSWIRFNAADAATTGDGLFSRASGNPSVPRWLGRLIFGLAYRVPAENDRFARQIRSSAGIAVFVSQRDDHAHWIEAGRCYQRFALQATALGIRNAFVNQPVEESRLRPAFARALALPGARPDLVVRFGHGPEMPRSLRRGVDAVIDGGAA